MAVALAKAGADLILVQRNTSNTETKSRIEKEGRKAEIVVCDLADQKQVAELIPSVTKTHTLDIVVNCGGIQRRHPVEVFPDDDWNEVLQVNLNTVFQITRDAGKHMLESRGGVAGTEGKKEWKSNGKIINISSLVAFQGGLNVVAYAAAKHGVQGIVSTAREIERPVIGRGDPGCDGGSVVREDGQSCAISGCVGIELTPRSSPSRTAGPPRASTSTPSRQATSRPT